MLPHGMWLGLTEGNQEMKLLSPQDEELPPGQLTREMRQVLKASLETLSTEGSRLSRLEFLLLEKVL